jgi:hypothetical protein
MKRTAKYTWQDYTTSEELKIVVVRKIQNYRNKWIHLVRRMDRDRHTATLNCEITTV